MSRRAIIPAAALALALGAAAAALPAGAAAAPAGGGGCQLTGNAKFVKGPNTTAHKFTYTFTGTLSNCQGSDSGTPATGKIGTLKPATGNGTCANGTTSGVALVTWADKTRTIIQYTTNSAAAEVVLQGSVIPKYKVGRTTYTTTRYKGDGAVGDLAFQADPQQCMGSGVTKAPIQGVTGIGYPKAG